MEREHPHETTSGAQSDAVYHLSKLLDALPPGLVRARKHA